MNQLSPFRSKPVMLAVVAGAVAMLFASCGGKSKADADLVVTSHAPNGTSVGNDSIQLSFDQPVVADEQIGQPLSAVPLSIEPALAVQSHWLDRQTLVAIPDREMARSTRYKVELTGELGKRTGGFSFEFVHEPLVVEGLWGVDLTQLIHKPTLPIHFNQPVEPAAVIEHCSLAAAGKSVALTLAESGTDAAEVVAVKPADMLAPATDYELTCRELAGAGGNVALTAPYVLALRTHAELSVEDVEPGGYDVPADDVEIAISFATPVDLETIREHLRAEPPIRGLDQGWLDRRGTHYKTTVNLKTKTRYKITVKSGLADIFGQTLSSDYTFSFGTGNARPRLSVETGIYALETSAPGYPVWTRNVGDFDVECATVPKSKLVKLLTSGLDYDPWYDPNGDQRMDWAEHGLRSRDKQVTIKDAKNNWHLSNLKLNEMCGGSDQRGIFLAEIQSDDIELEDGYEWRYRPYRRVLANVTDLGILLKAGAASGLVWVTAISTGQPVPGASVTIYTPEGKVAHRGQTDASGLLRIPGASQLLKRRAARGGDDGEFMEEEYYSRRSQRLFAVVEKAGDLAVVDGNWANGIQTWNFGISEDRRGGVTRIRGFIQSDRGIYRPGETVHFKGLVREIAIGKAPAVPNKGRIKVRIEDSRGQSVYNRSQKLSEFGGFAFDLPLTSEANLGDYYVTASIKGQTFREKFSVEEFRKVSFELDLAGAERHGRIGDKLVFKLGADYLFGAPVVGADVEWNVYRREHTIRFPKYSQYNFGDYAARDWDYWYYDYEDEGGYTDFVSDGEGQTNRRGRYRFSVRDPKRDFDGPQDYIIGVTVSDETDQAVSTRTVVTAHKSDFYLGLHTQEFVQAVDMPFAVNTVALDPEGERVATKARLSFIRETYTCDWSGGYRSYRTCKEKHE
ncbi:MAG: MG2 domain-containing protein, partial [Myxococcota bacterium]